MPWLGARKTDGYGTLSVHGRGQIAHRVVWELDTGASAAGLVIRHLCNNAWCVNPRHLRAGTQADNQRDKVVAGRQAKGEHNGRAKLTEDDVRLIIYRLSTGEGCEELGQAFGVTRRAIRLIQIGKNWAHVHARPRQSYLPIGTARIQAGFQ